MRDPLERAYFNQVVEAIERELSFDEKARYNKMVEKYETSLANQYLKH